MKTQGKFQRLICYFVKFIFTYFRFVNTFSRFISWLSLFQEKNSRSYVQPLREKLNHRPLASWTLSI